MEERIRIENIVKTFGPTVANKDVTIAVRPGSVHGLAGENGSGKSTLASIITGMQKPDSGKMFKDGKPYQPENPIDANNKKVAMVVQELGIIGSLPPAVNMFLGKTDQFARNGVIQIGDMVKAAKAQFAKWQLPEIPLSGMTETLSIEQRKILELARALSCDPDFLILDEISQALSQDTREVLYKFIKKFTSEGRSILMITHDLDEMLQICDTISVLRDGEVIETKASDEYTISELQKMMIGREVSGDYYRNDNKADYQDEVILKVDHLTKEGMIKNVSFDLHKGEILAVCGLSDAGIHDIGKVMFGIEKAEKGTITDETTGKQIKNASDVLNSKGAYLSKDRDSDGLMLHASIKQNLTIPNAKRLAGPVGFLNPSKVNKMAQDASDTFEIKSEGINSIVGSLSGGNKQKVNLSRWLIQDLKWVILDCPTRGVDVGVKAYIYGVLRDAKARGVGILMITDELNEAIGMADRILIMREHEQVGLIDRGSDFDPEKMAEVML